MKKPVTLSLLLVVIIALPFLQGCFKDTATKTYTIYTPIYRTAQEVRNGITSSAPVPIQHPGKIFVRGNYIFLNEIDKGVHIIDNSNPAAPVNKHFIAIPGNLDLAVKDNILYADLYRDLIAIDIANPSAIQVKKITENAFPARTFLNGFIGDPQKIIVGWNKKDTTVPAEFNTWDWADRIFLASNAFANEASPGVTGISGSMARFTLLNNYLYTVTNSNLNVFNVTQSDNPVFSNTINAGWNIETIYPFKGNLFIGSRTGMFIFNTVNPEQPVRLSQFQHLTSCDPVIADDKFAYVTLRSGTMCNGSTINQLDILNIQNLQSPSLIKTYPLTNPHGLSKVGNTLFVCDGKAGLKVFNVSDVYNLVPLATIGGIDAYDIITLNNTAIVVANDGLYQYNISNLNNITRLSALSYKM